MMRIAGLLLGCLLYHCAHAAPTVLLHGNLVDVERRAVVPDSAIVFEGEQIVAVGRAGSVPLPADARVIDVRGKWVMPGMVDAHIHLFQSGGLYTRPDVIDLRKVRSYEVEQAWVRDNAADLLARYLAAGITTVLDIGGPLANYALRDRFKQETRAPAILLTGPLVSTYQPQAFQIEDSPILKAADAEAARALVRQQLPYKPDFIKIWYVQTRDLPARSTLPIVQAAIEEAHSYGLKVAVHATQLETARMAVEAGADVLVHSVDGAPVDARFIELLKRRNVPYIPTLNVARRYGEALTGTHQPSPRDYLLANPFALGSLDDLHHMPDAIRQMPPAAVQAAAERNRVMSANLQRLSAAGVVIATGTDAGNIGTAHASSYLDELLAMRQAGLGSWEILRASTLNGARVFGRQQQFGSIVAGKQANLLILDRDPVADVANTSAVHAVVNRGTWLEPAALIDSSPAALVQQSLNGYNHRDMDAFLAPFSEDVEIYRFPNELQAKGKSAVRKGYAEFFARAPQLHAEVLSRIVLGNTVIDREHVTVGGDRPPLESIAIYTVADGKIARVTFIF